MIRWVLIVSLVTGGWFYAPMAHGQGSNYIFSERSSSRPHGEFVYAWNATGSEILDGTVVMIDTTGTTVQPQIPLGKGFRTWDGVNTKVHRILGVTLGNIPGYAQGRVMRVGYHNNVLMAATGVTGMTTLKPSLTVVGSLAAWAIADTTSVFNPRVGTFHRYKNTTELRGRCWLDFSGMGAK